MSLAMPGRGTDSSCQKFLRLTKLSSPQRQPAAFDESLRIFWLGGEQLVQPSLGFGDLGGILAQSRQRQQGRRHRRLQTQDRFVFTHGFLTTSLVAQGACQRQMGWNVVGGHGHGMTKILFGAFRLMWAAEMPADGAALDERRGKSRVAFDQLIEGSVAIFPTASEVVTASQGFEHCRRFGLVAVGNRAEPSLIVGEVALVRAEQSPF